MEANHTDAQVWAVKWTKGMIVSVARGKIEASVAAKAIRAGTTRHWVEAEKLPEILAEVQRETLQLRPPFDRNREQRLDRLSGLRKLL